MFKIKKLYFSGGSRRANTTHMTLLKKLFYLSRSNSKIYVHIIYVLHVIFLTLSQNINPKQTLHTSYRKLYNTLLFSSFFFLLVMISYASHQYTYDRYCFISMLYPKKNLQPQYIYTHTLPFIFLFYLCRIKSTILFLPRNI